MILAASSCESVSPMRYKPLRIITHFHKTKNVRLIKLQKKMVRLLCQNFQSVQQMKQIRKNMREEVIK